MNEELLYYKMNMRAVIQTSEKQAKNTKTDSTEG